MSSVIEMLAKTHSRYNKGRNRILTVAVCLCILTLTIVFGIVGAIPILVCIGILLFV